MSSVVQRSYPVLLACLATQNYTRLQLCRLGDKEPLWLNALRESLHHELHCKQPQNVHVKTQWKVLTHHKSAWTAPTTTLQINRLLKAGLAVIHSHPVHRTWFCSVIHCNNNFSCCDDWTKTHLMQKLWKDKWLVLFSYRYAASNDWSVTLCCAFCTKLFDAHETAN